MFRYFITASVSFYLGGMVAFAGIERVFTGTNNPINVINWLYLILESLCI